jgi:Skp family chaperone for outer membrane proteins
VTFEAVPLPNRSEVVKMSKAVGAVIGTFMALSVALNGLLLLGGRATAEGTPKVGVVDVARVTDSLKQSPEWQRMIKQFEDQRAEFRVEIQRMTKVRYLDDKDLAELSRLRANPTPTRADRRRIEELESKSNKLDQEFQRLAGIEKPTESQARSLSEIQRLRERLLETLKDEEQKRAQRLAQSEADLLEVQNNKVGRAAAEVARERHFDLVVDRQLVLFGGQEATDDLLGKLALKP